MAIVTILAKSVWWPYVQSVINTDFIETCIAVKLRVCKIYLFNDGLTSVLMLVLCLPNKSIHSAAPIKNIADCRIVKNSAAPIKNIADCRIVKHSAAPIKNIADCRIVKHSAAPKKNIADCRIVKHSAAPIKNMADCRTVKHSAAPIKNMADCRTVKHSASTHILKQQKIPF